MPGDITWLTIPITEWAIVRSFDEAVQWVKDNGFPKFISFDHDLGWEKFDTNENGIIVVTEPDIEKSGYDFAKWLIEYDLDTNLMPDDFAFTVHSMNPVGAANISRILNSYLKAHPAT
jgi:hypothetical protein